MLEVWTEPPNDALRFLRTTNKWGERFPHQADSGGLLAVVEESACEEFEKVCLESGLHISALGKTVSESTNEALITVN